jgi:hypothetical protein
MWPGPGLASGGSNRGFPPPDLEPLLAQHSAPLPPRRVRRDTMAERLDDTSMLLVDF